MRIDILRALRCIFFLVVISIENATRLVMTIYICSRVGIRGINMTNYYNSIHGAELLYNSKMLTSPFRNQNRNE